MSDTVVENFIAALGKLEAGRDVESIAALFAERAEVGNVVTPEKYHGVEGARKFWSHYRETFGEVRSTFRQRIVGEGRAALEWETRGTAAGGAPIAYDGVSLLEMEGGKIVRFRAYFDAGALGRQVASA